MPPQTLEFHKILSPDRDGNILVAWHPDGTFTTLAQFRHAVANLAAQLQQTPETRYALCLNNALHMAIALFAAIYAKKQIILPGHTRPAQLRNQQSFFDAILSDDPALQLPLPILQVTTPISTLNSLATPAANVTQASKPAPSPSQTTGNLPPPLGAAAPSNSTRGSAAEESYSLVATRYSLVEGGFAAFNSATVTFFTSGSTGAPKPIVKKFEQLEIENQAQAARWADKIDNTLVAGTTSHLHLYGFQFRVLLPLSRGVPFNSALVEFHEQILSLKNPPALITSPAFLKRLDPQLPKTKLPFILSAGGFLPPAVAETSEKILGIAPFEILGSTEAGAMAWRDNSTERTLWTPLPCVQINADPDGRLLLRSPFLPDSDIFATDDQIQFSPDQKTFRLIGRLDRTVKIEEKRVALPEVETRLIAHPLITDAAVVPLHSKTRTILGALLVLNDEGRRQLHALGKGKFLLQLRAALRPFLEPVALPRQLHILETIPANSQGKRHTHELQALFNNNSLPHLLSHTLTAATVRLEIRLQPQLLWFKGHFENTPILPALAQLHWAIHYAAQFLDAPKNLHSIDSIKFKKLLQPDDLLTLTLTLTGNKLHFTYLLNNNTPASLGTLTLAP